jgi:hypothetical protein
MPGRDACIVRRILAPLDGSRLAEAVLPSLIALATRFGAEVALLHVLEERPPATIHGEAHLADLQAAEGYLQRAASRLADAGVSVELHAHETREGSVAGSIVVTPGRMVVQPYRSRGDASGHAIPVSEEQPVGGTRRRRGDLCNAAPALCRLGSELTNPPGGEHASDGRRATLHGVIRHPSFGTPCGRVVV